jgi:hypothetical protein
MTDLLARLNGVSRSGDGWTARCPAHEDRHNSLSIHSREGRWLIKCHAGCEWEEIIGALGLDASALFDDRTEGRPIPSNNRATAQPKAKSRKAGAAEPSQALEHRATSGLTFSQYAAAKGLSIDFLKACGVSEFSYDRKPALRIPYLGPDGQELAVRFRIAIDGDRFRWKSGTKPCLYGLHRLAEAQNAGQVVLVEGESDCHTLWLHGIPAVGIPGAGNWREERDARHFDGIETIYVVIESDRGGDAVQKWLSRSTIRDRARLVRLLAKDTSALYLQRPDEFARRWQVACLGAMPWSAVEAEANAAERTEAWEQCSGLARKANILEAFDQELSRLGLVGERRAAKLIYLAVTSRLLDRPVSVAVKGPSSGGKSFVVETTLKFFPPAAFYSLTAMSDRALAYSNEPLQHRHLVIYEAAGMASDFATYLIRSLLSEGCVRYETVEKTKDGLVPRLIKREGPTGLIVTTTSLRLHPENETRMLSLTITDTHVQTAAVFRALAQESIQADADLQWHALQTWLTTGPTRVVIPFAEKLSRLVPPVAVRLRRDFKTVLMLIRAHALLHQASRLKDEQGLIVAALEDYAAVRELVADLVAEGVEATVKPEIREVVEATARLIEEGLEEVRQADLKGALKLDKSAISRRVAGALDGGFLKNLEDRKGRPARLVLGDPLPANQEVLPAPDHLIDSDRLHGCAVDLGDRAAPAPQAKTIDAADQQCETPASNGHCAIVPFDLLVPPGADDAITGKASKCAQCGKGGDVLETYIGTPTPVWLHRECADAWLASCDDLSIPVYLDRRSELRVGAGTTPDRGATNGGQL